MKDKKDIAALISGCRKGQARYQKALVDNYSDLLFSVCRRYMGEDSKAQDALQETFIRVFRSFNTYDAEKGALTSWMRKIAVNCCLRSLSKKNLEISNLSIVDYDQRYSINAAAVSNLQKEDLLDLVKSLPDGYRQVFNLSVIEGYSHREIGIMLGIKAVSSRSNLSRAKDLLRKKISELNSKEQWTKTN